LESTLGSVALKIWLSNVLASSSPTMGRTPNELPNFRRTDPKRLTTFPTTYFDPVNILPLRWVRRRYGTVNNKRNIEKLRFWVYLCPFTWEKSDEKLGSNVRIE
jgi:hypothetical protein